MTDQNEQEFLRRLRATFRMEAEEHLRTLASGLLELEKTENAAQCAGIIESIFRETHSLKGAARSVNLRDIEAICQPLENQFAALKRQEISLTATLLDLLRRALNTLNQLVVDMETDPSPEERAKIRDLIRLLTATGTELVTPETALQSPVLGSSLPLDEPQTYPEAETVVSTEIKGPVSTAVLGPLSVPSISETVRLPIARLEPLLLQSEELIQAKLAGTQRLKDLQAILQGIISWRVEAEKKQDQRTLSTMWVTDRIDALVEDLSSVCGMFDQDQRTLRKMVDDHMGAMKQVLMLPVSTLVEVFPRLVRDLAQDQDKKVELVINGADLEIDKRILEALKDPLVHLLRNCIDHGIEMPAVRASRNKPEHGTITLTFNARDSRNMEVLISDDGAGIDIKEVCAAAVRAGNINAETAGKLDAGDAYALVFQSGISTSKIITDLSGRGLGLAIVCDNVEQLGGSVSVDSGADTGTTFRMLLPMTLATFRGVLVRARGQEFVLPTSSVERTFKVDEDAIRTVKDHETIRVNGDLLPLARLGNLLDLPQHNGVEIRGRPHAGAESTAGRGCPVLVLVGNDQRIAVLVDEVLAEQEIRVKGLGRQMRRVRNIAGATVLGSGQVVPVLNIPDLMKTASRPGATNRAPVPVDEETRRNHLLVAEDSITTRSLLRNILETEGYQVTTAVDGADAFDRLREGNFDLVVSDVDMPRMSGFELTARIRGDQQLAEMPVVLVTALESRADREHGIEVGANAYIVKSSFEQSNLLDVIRQLL